MLVCSSNAVISFHDDRIVAPALREVLKRLESQSIRFTAVKLQGSTFAILLGEESISNHILLQGMATDGRQALRRLQRRIFLKRFVPRPLLPVASRLFGQKD
jgi:hypothetical protein